MDLDTATPSFAFADTSVATLPWYLRSPSS